MAASTVKGKKQSWTKLLPVILGLVLINILSWFASTQFDLTKDKRYTITNNTRTMLKGLSTKVEVLVYLEGEHLPAAFQSLRNSTLNTLQQFRDISNNNLSFRTIDPFGKDTSALLVLKQYGMTGIPVTIAAGKKGTEQKTLFPWALVTMVDSKGQSLAYPVFLQEINTFNLNRKTLLKSEILLEYNLANGIHQLSKGEKENVAYLMGNGEQFDERVVALMGTLQQFYRLDTFNINQQAAIPLKYKTIVIQRPTEPFTEQQKFKLDQYLMGGGNIYWSINTVTGTLDSLRGGRFNAMPIELNLSDLLFQYGVRINTNLVLDAVNHAFVPLQAPGNKSELSMFPWVYFPVLQSAGTHSIVQNLNGVLSRFVSSLDTNANDIQKTILLNSSRYSKTESVPQPILLESAIEQINAATFNQGNLITAVLLEGKFTSAFSTRRPDEVNRLIDSFQLKIIDRSSKSGKMIVTSDAEILVNEFSTNSGPSDMGQYNFDQTVRFDNKTFFVNCMEYLNDEHNLLAARNKSFDERVLDPKIVEREGSFWQLINIGVPVASVIVFGLVFFYIRKRKYA